MIDRDTIIDLVAAVDTAFEKLEAGTYNEFDKYAAFVLHIEAIARAAEREACAKVAEVVGQDKNHIGIAAAIRARRDK